MTGEIGSRISNYRLIRLLGQGNFANVYLGEHISSQAQTAIKLFRTRLADDNVQNFLYDTQSVANLHHRHILSIIDFGVEKDGHPFIIRDYARGGTLRMRYPYGTQCPLEIVVTYMSAITNALAYAHNANLIHCDIKPGNILLGDRPNDIFLGDFSIETLARIRSSHRIVDKVVYIAPEQVSDRPTTASDQYALAVIAYELLSGSLPYQGNFAEIVRQRSSMKPSSLHRRYSEISPSVDEVILRALEYKPEDRFASIQDFFRALERAYLTGQKTGPLPVLAIPNQGSKAGKIIQDAFQKDPSFLGLSQSQNVKSPRRTVLISLIGLAGIVVSEAVTGRANAFLQRPGSTVFVYHGHSGKVLSVQWSPDDKYLVSASSDRTVQIWQSGTDHPISIYQGHRAVVISLAWSPDGRYIASGGEDRTIQIWLPDSLGSVITYTRHSGTVNAIAWSPNGKYIASGGEDKTVRIWLATDTDRSLDKVYSHDGIVNAVAWSHDSRYVMSASDDNTVQVWDTYENDLIFTKVHDNRVLAVASGTGPGVNSAASGGYDGQVHIWDFIEHQRLITYKRHEGKIHAILWSLNGQSIISASADKTVQVWNSTSGVPFLTYRGHTDEVLSIAQSHNGKFIASGSLDTTVQIWQMI